MQTAVDLHPAWLGEAHMPVMLPPSTPDEAAQRELGAFFAGRAGRAVLRLEPGMDEAYAIQSDADGYVITGGESGVLYGAFALIRAGKPRPTPCAC